MDETNEDSGNSARTPISEAKSDNSTGMDFRRGKGGKGKHSAVQHAAKNNTYRINGTWLYTKTDISTLQKPGPYSGLGHSDSGRKQQEIKNMN